MDSQNYSTGLFEEARGENITGRTGASLCRLLENYTSDNYPNYISHQAPHTNTSSKSPLKILTQVIFYEDRKFQGRSYECMSDCADMSSYLSRCHSCRIESGCFMMYDRPNYMGNQYFFRKGDYADYMSMFGMNDCIRSCRMIPMHRGSYRLKIYERENFGGQMYELMDDCDNIMDRYRMSHCQSCHVMDGHWLMYEQPQYRGRMMYLRPGEYRSFREMGGTRFMSMRRIIDSMY